MIRSIATALCLFVGVSGIVAPPPAKADELVLYEVISGYIRTVDIDYNDGSQIISLKDVPLPWRMTASIADPASRSSDGAKIHAQWKEAAKPSPSWVTVRIYVRGSLICESYRDWGDAACEGDLERPSGRLGGETR
jgi:hypothetical protein